MKKMYNILIATIMMFFGIVVIGEIPINTMKEMIVVKENSIEIRTNDNFIEIDKEYFELKAGL